MSSIGLSSTSNVVRAFIIILKYLITSIEWLGGLGGKMQLTLFIKVASYIIKSALIDSELKGRFEHSVILYPHEQNGMYLCICIYLIRNIDI